MQRNRGRRPSGCHSFARIATVRHRFVARAIGRWRRTDPAVAVRPATQTETQDGVSVGTSAFFRPVRALPAYHGAEVCRLFDWVKNGVR